MVAVGVCQLNTQQPTKNRHPRRWRVWTGGLTNGTSGESLLSKVEVGGRRWLKRRWEECGGWRGGERLRPRILTMTTRTTRTKKQGVKWWGWKRRGRRQQQWGQQLGGASILTLFWFNFNNQLCGWIHSWQREGVVISTTTTRWQRDDIDNNAPSLVLRCHALLFNWW